jgi:hypothetical protein
MSSAAFDAVIDMASTLSQAEIKSNDHITFQQMEENGDFTNLKIDKKRSKNL